MTIYIEADLSSMNGNLSISKVLVADRYGNMFTNSINNSITNVMAIPDNFNIGNNYPNPFNPSTNVKISFPKFIQLYLQLSIGKH